MGRERYSRHLALFGDEGQARIAEVSVGIVGLGGLGAHVVQQLAYLGVRHFHLIDGDRVSLSNLNRLVTASVEDLGVAKVEVAARMIERVQPGAIVAQSSDPFDPDADPSGLAETDLVFGCLDSDVPRLSLTRFASTIGMPYLDLASDITPDGVYGGRVAFAIDGDRCLSCLGEIDQHELARGQMTPEQRQADDAIYGVSRAALANHGPSVVSINGVVASLAVTEFTVWVAGLRPPKGFLTYRADLGTVTYRPDGPRDHCVYCMDIWPRSS